MLEVLARWVCAMIMAINGFYIINKIMFLKIEKVNLKEWIYILLISLVSFSLYPIHYSGLYSVSVLLLYIIVYKYVFNIPIRESIISCSLMMIILCLGDMLSSLILMGIFEIEKIRTNPILSIMTNLIVSGICIIIVNIPKLNTQLNKFYHNIRQKKVISTSIFLILIIIDFTYLVNNIEVSEFFNKDYIINFVAIMIFLIIAYLFIQSKNDYRNLEIEYDSLFNYIQTFEDWIEKEQLNRHEYKNQLAVLRCLTKEKKVKGKIDEILEDNINIEGQAVTNLKKLPKGGIKGLMYYKSAIAQKQKIHLTTDVSINEKGILSKLAEKEIRILCKLIGIYFDNAIEAAAESKKKNIMIEVYELNDKVNFVFSNTFKNHKNLKDRNKKGISSKGEGRGNGLYFASKLIKNNPWLEQTQEIIDGYYIQQVSVKCKNAKKKEFNP